MRAFIALIAGGALVAATPARADVIWFCALSEQLDELVCRADSVPAAPVADDTADDAGSTRYPLDAARTWVVPLWTPPTDPALLVRLAQATLCFRTPRCTAVVAPAPATDVPRQPPAAPAT